MANALIIGGTGMLKEATLWLNERYGQIYVVGTNAQKLACVKKEAVKADTLICDYYNLEAWERKLESLPPIDLVMIWMRSDAEKSFNSLMACIKEKNSEAEVYHIKSYGAQREHRYHKFSVPGTFNYHEILLGFMIENGRSRWLTHSEISHGTIEAIAEQEDKKIIGTLTPWERRP